MSEIEKLYELAGVEQKYFEHFHGDGYDYPPFTVEKQLELIKLLCQQCDLTISHFSKWDFVHYDGQEPINLSGKDFVETLAKLVNMYWQDLTETEKAEIKRILENE